MIKIVDTVPHRSVVRQAICGSCGCTLEYTPADVRAQVMTDYTGCRETITYIQCPNCTHEVHI